MRVDILVRKRNGRVVPFDGEKIKDAIREAFKKVGVNNSLGAAEYIEGKITNYVIREYSYSNAIIDVNDLQDWVEDALMDFDKRAAKAYIKERFYQDVERRFRCIFEV